MKNSTCYDIFQIAASDMVWWAQIKWDTRKTNDDGSFSIDVMLCEDVDDENRVGRVFVLTDDSIRQGCEHYGKGNWRYGDLATTHARLNAFKRFLETDGAEGDIDSWSANDVVQYACFGEVVFS